MSQTITEPLKINADEAAAIHRAAEQARKVAMTIGRPQQPAKTPMQAGQHGEATVMMLVDKSITLTTQDGGRVTFGIGLQPVPGTLANHWFVAAANFKRYGAGPAVGAEPERAPELPATAAPSLDEAVAGQLQAQSLALLEAKSALADKDAALAEMQAKLDAATKPPDAGPKTGAQQGGPQASLDVTGKPDGKATDAAAKAAPAPDPGKKT